jgi:hypothetical protein
MGQRRRLRASSFLVSDHSNARLNTEGVVVAQHKGLARSGDIDRTVGHAVESARLEGVEFDAAFVTELVYEAAGWPATARPKVGRHGSRAT